MSYKVNGWDTVEPTISFACTHCRGGLKAPLTDAGSEHACPTCHVPLLVPAEKELKAWLDERLATAAQTEHPAATVQDFERAKANEDLRENAHASQSAPQMSAIELPWKILELIHGHEQIIYASRPSNAALILKMVLYGLLFGIISIGVLLPFVLLFVYLSWKNTYYIITNERTLVMTGVFNVATKIIINRNIQLISINTGIVDRWLGLNSIELATAAQGGGDSGIFTFFPGMSRGCVTLRQVEIADVVKHYAYL